MTKFKIDENTNNLKIVYSYFVIPSRIIIIIIGIYVVNIV